MKKKIVLMLILCALSICSCAPPKDDNNTEISSESVISIQDSEKETETEIKPEDVNLDKDTEKETDSESVISIQNNEKETGIGKENINVEEKPVEDIDSALQIEQQKEENIEEDVSNQIKINLTNSSIEAKSLENISVIVTNDSKYDITTGEQYWVSKLNGEQWEEIPVNIVWNDLGIQIKAGSSHEFNYNLSLIGNFEKDVKYCITKKVYVNQKEYTLSTDFTVN